MYQALKGRIIAEIIPHKTRTESGLSVIRQNDFPLKARVISCGGKTGKFNPPCKEGDVIFIKRYSATSLENLSSRDAQMRGKVALVFGDVVGVLN